LPHHRHLNSIDRHSMLLAECPSTSLSESSTSDSIRLQLRDSLQAERTIVLSEGKHTIGSGPRCAVRLIASDVQPLECVIVRRGDEVRVRRWAPHTRLNGIDFDEAEMRPGDTLQMGTAEIEVLGPHFDPILEPEFDSVKTPQPKTESVLLDAPCSIDQIMVQIDHDQPIDFDRPEEVKEQPRDRKATRTRRRKWLAAVREYRSQYEELLNRVASLEARVASALAESDHSLADSSLDGWQLADETTALEEANTVLGQEAAEDSASDDWLVTARPALSADEFGWVDSIRQGAEEPTAPTEPGTIDSELAELRQQLAESQLQATQAQARIALLEQQLAENQRMLQSFAEERASWQSQLADTEKRLGQYVERIQELASQLDATRSDYVDTSPEVGLAASPVRDDHPTLVDIAAASLTQEDDLATDSQAEWIAESPACNTNLESTSIVSPDATSSVGGELSHHGGKNEPEDETPRQSADEAFEFVVEESSANPSIGVADEIIATDQGTIEKQAGDLGEHSDDSASDVESPATESRDDSNCRAELETVAVRHESADPPIEPCCVGAFGEAPLVEKPAGRAESKSPSATSFIERYSHLFDEDDGASAGQTSQVSGHSSNPAVPSSQAPANEEDESVEQYMARLLERMRGSGREQSTPYSNRASNSPNSTGMKVDHDAAVAIPPTPAEVRPRMPAPEFAADMDALRALANQSARHAIGIHSARTFRHKLVAKIVLAFLAGMACVYLLLESPSWNSLQFVTACIAGLAALYWARLTYDVVRKAASAGGFDTADNNFVAVDDSRPPLPIDGRK
jgi:uncharacterized coiled-coil protein SlyX